MNMSKYLFYFFVKTNKKQHFWKYNLYMQVKNRTIIQNKTDYIKYSAYTT